MKLPSIDKLEMKRAVTKQKYDFWKRRTEREIMHLELYLSDKYIEKFGDEDAQECAANIQYFSALANGYKSRLNESLEES